MALVLTSPSCIAPDGKPDEAVICSLQAIVADGDVAVVSHHAKPEWFDESCAGLKFFRTRSRGDGELIKENTKRLNCEPHEFLVLAGNESDIAMAKNSGAVLIGAGWSQEERVAQSGLHVDTPEAFLEIAQQLDEWPGAWFWKAEVSQMRVRSLCDLSTYYKPDDQERFGSAVTSLVKNGGSQLSALTALACRSLLSEGVLPSTLAYGLYPSSSSNNDDTDTLSETLHAVRMVTSRVRYARRNEPLLIRWEAAPKRSRSATDRLDPAHEINTLCVNPAYQGKLRGRTIILLDDCTTYGLSFSVARALLLAAGAQDVLAVALGKLGRKFHFTDIALDKKSDCYKQSNKPFAIKSQKAISGKSDSDSQSELIRIFSEHS